MYEYRAKIISVYDGDTMTAIVDLGFYVKVELKLRLMGIDTPEIRGEERPEGLVVRDYVREMVLEKEVIIKTYKDKQEKYGRWLAEIFLEDQNLNAHLLEKGMAKPYRV